MFSPQYWTIFCSERSSFALLTIALMVSPQRSLGMLAVDIS